MTIDICKSYQSISHFPASCHRSELETFTESKVLTSLAPMSRYQTVLKKALFLSWIVAWDKEQILILTLNTSSEYNRIQWWIHNTTLNTYFFNQLDTRTHGTKPQELGVCSKLPSYPARHHCPWACICKSQVYPASATLQDMAPASVPAKHKHTQAIFWTQEPLGHVLHTYVYLTVCKQLLRCCTCKPASKTSRGIYRDKQIMNTQHLQM